MAQRLLPYKSGTRYGAIGCLNIWSTDSCPKNTNRMKKSITFMANLFSIFDLYGLRSKPKLSCTCYRLSIDISTARYQYFNHI